MSARAIELFNELSQLIEQYKVEVPSGRRAWPRSIRDRTVELRKLGLSYLQISERCQIPVATLYSWAARQAKGAVFVPVKVVSKPRPKRVPTVTVRSDVSPPRSEVAAPTVTVVMPSGMKILGLVANENLGALLGDLATVGVK